MFVGAAEHTVDDDTLRSTLIGQQDALRAFIYSHLPQRLQGRISVDDILQEVWIISHRKLSCFRADRPDALERWLMGITQKRTLNVIQTEMRLKRGDAQMRPNRMLSYADLFAGVVFRGRTPSGEAAVGEASDAVRAAMAELPLPRRNALTMRYVQNKSCEEIARQTGQTLAAVHGLLFQGLRQLHELLGPAGRYLSDAPSADPDATAPD